jgi:hypothetical protein
MRGLEPARSGVVADYLARLESAFGVEALLQKHDRLRARVKKTIAEMHALGDGTRDDEVRAYLQRRLFVLHGLLREVSGAIVVATYEEWESVNALSPERS